MSRVEQPPAPRYWFPKPYADFVQRLRVSCGFLLLVSFAWLSRPSPRSILIGMPVALLGLTLRGWAAGHLAKDQELATGGPYAYLRNPLYAGTVLAAFGIVLASRSISLAVLFTFAFALVYLPAIELEEQHLREIFPDYQHYAARVPKLLAWRKPVRTVDCFSWMKYWRNEEYKALIGFCVAVVWLLWACYHGPLSR